MIDYRDYQPKKTTRIHENIEWTTTYTYNANDTAHPRVLLIGDSICGGYHAKVREKLAEQCNVTYWASSKCVTDPQYFRELDFLLDSYHYDLISFNNGLHSLGSDQAEWEAAYRAAVAFIRAKCPDSRLTLTLCTSLNDPVRNATVLRLNTYIRALAAELGLPTLDLYAVMEPFDKTEHMRDVFHWKDEGKDAQAEAIRAHVLARLDCAGGNIQKDTETGPDGALK